MNLRFIRAVGGAAVLATAATFMAPAIAHHAFAAEFDAAKPVKVDGVITKVRMVNPHSWIYLDVKGKDGSVTNWGFEFGTPSSLKNNGLSKADVAIGTKIEINGYRAKNGGAFGYATLVGLGGGKRIQTGNAPGAPTQPRPGA